ncbi:MAG: phosphate ABC transporter permease subunit PstC [Salinirussus sp.]
MSAGTQLRNALSLDTTEFAVWGIGGISLLAAFALFMLGSTLTIVPVILFVGTAAVGWIRVQSATARGLSIFTTLVTVVTFGLIIFFLVREAWPAFEYEGLSLLFDSSATWQFSQTGESNFTLLPMMYGTLATTLVATAIAAPLGISGALFISEMAPNWAREIVKPGVEILAGIPSVVYGFIGFVVLNQYMYENMGLAGFGNFFIVGVVIGLMALPTVVSVAEDAVAAVPDAMKDGSMAMGATDWQTMKSVTIPAAFSGVSAAVLLGIGRAIGETMAATIMLSHVKNIPEPLYDIFQNGETLTSVIAFEYGNAGRLQLDALFAAGVVLFITVMFLSIGSQIIERRMEKKLGGQA